MHLKFARPAFSPWHLVLRKSRENYDKVPLAIFIDYSKYSVILSNIRSLQKSFKRVVCKTFSVWLINARFWNCFYNTLRILCMTRDSDNKPYVIVRAYEFRIRLEIFKI